MAFFFDMDNPAVQNDFDYEDEAEEEEEEEFEVELLNGLPGVELDIVRIHDVFEDQVWKKVFDKVTTNETAVYYAFEGDKLRALISGTNEVVSDIEIYRDQYVYTFSHENFNSLMSEL